MHTPETSETPETLKTPPRRRRSHWKGERIGTYVALPVDLRQAVDARAAQEGLPLGDFVTRLLAEGIGEPAPARCYPANHSMQEELPLNQAS